MHMTRQLLLKILPQVKGSWDSPINIFRANRRQSDDQLSVAGNPARWTSFDHARSERHRRAVSAAYDALELARADQAKPYSLVSEVARMSRAKTKSALTLLGALGLATAGAVLGICAAIQARKPDWVLVQAAMQVQEAHRMPTASDERDFLFAMLGFGVLLLIGGLHAIREWWRPPR